MPRTLSNHLLRMSWNNHLVGHVSQRHKPSFVGPPGSKPASPFSSWGEGRTRSWRRSWGLNFTQWRHVESSTKIKIYIYIYDLTIYIYTHDKIMTTPDPWHAITKHNKTHVLNTCIRHVLSIETHETEVNKYTWLPQYPWEITVTGQPFSTCSCFGGENQCPSINIIETRSGRRSTPTGVFFHTPYRAHL